MATKDSTSVLNREVFKNGKGGVVPLREYLEMGPTTTIPAFPMKEGPDDRGLNG